MSTTPCGRSQPGVRSSLNVALIEGRAQAPSPETQAIMKRLLGLLLLALCFAAPVHAGPYGDALTTCFANSTTGKDRTDLARWIFVAMAQHPKMAETASISLEQRESVNRAFGADYSRLMGEACAQEVRLALEKEGEGTTRAGFEFLGKLAMQELMTNPRVAASFADTEKYIDFKKIGLMLRTN